MTATSVDLAPAPGTQTAEPQTATAEATEKGVKAGGRARARIQVGPVARKIGAEFRPPEFWIERAPSLKDVVMYAWHGEWTGERTIGRTLGRTYAVLVSIPAHVIGYVLLWLIARPARHAVAWLLIALIALTPPGGVALGAIATALRWVANLTA